MSNGRLAGKVAFITGAGSGVGRATALLFAQEGARVIAAGRTLSKCEETAEQVAGVGGECLPVLCDVAESDQVQTAITRGMDRFGELHVIVNNAGIGYAAEFADPPVSMQDALNTPDEDWDTVMNIILKSVFLTGKYGIPKIIDSGGGAVVNVSSMMGVRSSWDGHPYSAAKAGMNNLTGSLAMRYAGDNIRVNCVALGGINTPMIEERVQGRESPLAPKDARQPPPPRGIPLGRLGEPIEIAYPILWLASDEASYVTGAVLLADGGATLW